MINAVVEYKSKYGDPCKVTCSFFRMHEYYFLFSFNSHYYPAIHKDNMISIRVININKY